MVEHFVIMIQPGSQFRMQIRIGSIQIFIQFLLLWRSDSSCRYMEPKLAIGCV